jgi:Flp pilus assembly protein TadG
MSRRGAVAVELALIGVPLFFTIMACLEVILMTLVSSSLAVATTEAARQIRTGQLQASGTATATTFGQLVCSNMSWFASQCTSNIHVNAQAFQSFGTMTSPSVITGNTFNPAGLQFNMGFHGNIILVKTYMTWTLVTPMLAQAFGGLSNNQVVLSATSAFRNE